MTSVPKVFALKADPADYPVLTSEDEIRALLPALQKSGVRLGNSPFPLPVSEKANSTFVDPETQVRYVKPKLNMRSAYIRTSLFNRWDPLAFHLNVGETIEPDVVAFVDRYASISAPWTTDADGHRTTMPASTAEDVVLVVGDSVAFGILLRDDETLTSQLQQRHASVRFINAGLPGANFYENQIRLRGLIEKYGKRVRGLIYVHCENDTEGGRVAPEHIVNELSDLLDAHGIHYRCWSISNTSIRRCLN